MLQKRSRNPYENEKRHMSSASAIRKAATLPAPPNGAHSNSAPQAHRLGMTPNLTGTLRPQRAQVIFPIIDLRFTTPSAPLDDRAVTRVRQVLYSEPEDGVLHYPLTSSPDRTSARRRSMRGVSGSREASDARRAASSGDPCSSSYSAR